MKFAVAVVLLAFALGAEASVVAWGPVAHAGTWDGRSWNSAWDNGHNDWAARSALNNGQWHEGVWGDRSAEWAGNGAWAGEGAWAGPAVVATHSAAVFPAATIVSAGPAVIPAGVIPAGHGWAHEGSYVAKTRGAVHVAPLSGHANSAASINVAPAPGTV